MRVRFFLAAMIALCACSSVLFGRTWTDQQGKQLKADFVRMHLGNVVLKKVGGAVQSVPFYELSDSDQEFLRAELEKKGQAHQIPSRPAVQNPSNTDPQNSAAAPVTPDAPQPQQPPQSQPAQPGNRIGQRPPIPRPQFNMPKIEIPARPSLPVNTTPPPTPDPQPVVPRTPMMPRSQPRVPVMESVSVCSKCNKEVPANAKAGDRCPHCGTYWSYSEDSRGKREYAKWGAGGAVGVVISIIIGVSMYLRNK